MKKRTERARQALRLWRSEYAPRELQKANARKWIAAVEQLGPRWLLAQPKEQRQ